MKARFISKTEPSAEMRQQGINSAEDLIVYCARVSSPNNQGNTATGERLIRYLLEHKHFSPFEMADLCIEVETSRAISAQAIRHWAFSIQEFSQRYATAPTVFEPVEARAASAKNRQGSAESARLPWTKRALFKAGVWAAQALSSAVYKAAVSGGVAKEVARFVLPLSTQTRYYFKGSVRDWLFYLRTRTAPDTQKEHRDLALACAEIFAVQFPVIWSAFNDAKP